MNITMLGTSMSGKTAFMSGLYEALVVDRPYGFWLRTSSASDSLLQAGRSLDTISFNNLRYGFAPSTASTSLWSFDLMYQNYVVASFDWIDYRGGILTDISSPADDQRFRADIDELEGHILASNVLMLFVDSILLTEYRDIRRARRDAGVDRLISLLTHYSTQYPQRNLTFLIVLAKADAVKPEWKHNNYEPLINRGQEAFGQLDALCRINPTWIGGIVAVSAIGEGKAQVTITPATSLQTRIQSSVQLTEFPHPVNVEHAIFYCVGRTLRRMQEYTDDIIGQYDTDLQAALQKSTVLRRMWANITRQQSPREIALAIEAKRHEEYRALQQYLPFVNPLLITSQEAVKSFCGRV